MARPPRHVKVEVWQRDKYRCRYCRRPVQTPSESAPTDTWATVDHVTPLARGGTNAKGNLVTACLPCNQEKADGLSRPTGNVTRAKAGAALKRGFL
jgi:5-methylcytosine-specific restriction endonuclease McrA